jgi:hypothetical protein
VRERLGARRDECFFWATHAGAEIDLVVIRGRSRFYRVEVDVENQAIEIALVFNISRIVSPLPETARSAEPPVEPAAESVLDSMHPTPEGNRRGSNDQVEMVGHHTPSENRPSISLLDIPNDLDELHRLVRFSEDMLSTRDPVVHVVQTTFDDDSRPTRHCLVPLTPAYLNFPTS